MSKQTRRRWGSRVEDPLDFREFADFWVGGGDQVFGFHDDRFGGEAAVEGSLFIVGDLLVEVVIEGEEVAERGDSADYEAEALLDDGRFFKFTLFPNNFCSRFHVELEVRGNIELEVFLRIFPAEDDRFDPFFEASIAYAR